MNDTILQPGKPGQAGVPAERDLIFSEKEEADMAKAKAKAAAKAKPAGKKPVRAKK